MHVCPLVASQSRPRLPGVRKPLSKHEITDNSVVLTATIAEKLLDRSNVVNGLKDFPPRLSVEHFAFKILITHSITLNFLCCLFNSISLSLSLFLFLSCSFSLTYSSQSFTQIVSVAVSH